MRSPLLHRGDTIIVISYASYDAAELAEYEPVVVHVNRANQVITVDDQVATLMKEAA